MVGVVTWGAGCSALGQSPAPCPLQAPPGVSCSLLSEPRGTCSSPLPSSSVNRTRMCPSRPRLPGAGRARSQPLARGSRKEQVPAQGRKGPGQGSRDPFLVLGRSLEAAGRACERGKLAMAGLASSGQAGAGRDPALGCPSYPLPGCPWSQLWLLICVCSVCVSVSPPVPLASFSLPDLRGLRRGRLTNDLSCLQSIRSSAGTKALCGTRALFISPGSRGFPAPELGQTPPRDRRVMRSRLPRCAVSALTARQVGGRGTAQPRGAGRRGERYGWWSCGGSCPWGALLQGEGCSCPGPARSIPEPQLSLHELHPSWMPWKAQPHLLSLGAQRRRGQVQVPQAQCTGMSGTTCGEVTSRDG